MPFLPSLYLVALSGVLAPVYAPLRGQRRPLKGQAHRRPKLTLFMPVDQSRGLAQPMAPSDHKCPKVIHRTYRETFSTIIFFIYLSIVYGLRNRIDI